MACDYLQGICYSKRTVYKHTTPAERKAIKAALVNGASVPGILNDFIILHPEKIVKYDNGTFGPIFTVNTLYQCVAYWKRTHQIPNVHRNIGKQIKMKVFKERTTSEILL